MKKQESEENKGQEEKQITEQKENQITKQKKKEQEEKKEQKEKKEKKDPKDQEEKKEQEEKKDPKDQEEKKEQEEKEDQKDQEDPKEKKEQEEQEDQKDQEGPKEKKEQEEQEDQKDQEDPKEKKEQEEKEDQKEQEEKKDQKDQKEQEEKKDPKDQEDPKEKKDQEEQEEKEDQKEQEEKEDQKEQEEKEDQKEQEEKKDPKDPEEKKEQEDQEEKEDQKEQEEKKDPKDPKDPEEKKEQEEEKKIKEQEDFDNCIWKWKIGIIILVALTIVVVDLLRSGYYAFFCQFILFVVPCCLISFWWTRMFHFCLFKKICGTYIKRDKYKITDTSKCVKIFEEDANNNAKNYKYYLIQVFSPDYLYAKIFKYLLSHNNEMNDKCSFREQSITSGKHLYSNIMVKCEKDLKADRYMCERHQEKKRLQKFVIYSNWINLMLAGALMTVCLILSAAFDVSDKCPIIKYYIVKYLFILVLVHIISRAIEVSFAFYNDVVKAKMTKDLKIGERSTNLKRGHRISLAVHTYVEFILLFSILYFLEPNLINWDVFSHLNNYVEFILYSASVAAFNISFDVKQLTTFGKIIHTLQVFLSINLVVLSIATYLGFKDEMSEFEKVDWEKEKKNSR